MLGNEPSLWFCNKMNELGVFAVPGVRISEVSVQEYNIGGKIRELRSAKKLTLQDVANETGFSTSLLSQIENNNISPPIATLSKIASFFDVRIGHFFAEEEEDCSFEVMRCSERTIMPRVISQDGSRHGYFFESLSVRKKNKKMEPFLLTLNQKVVNTDTYCHSGEEFLFVRIEVYV